MITETNIRPIPKYMLNKIEKLDKSTYQKRDAKSDFIDTTPNLIMNLQKL